MARKRKGERGVMLVSGRSVPTAKRKKREEGCRIGDDNEGK